MSSELKLNQALAVHKGAKNRYDTLVKEVNKAVQKKQLFEGSRRTFQRLKEDGPEFPDERQEVQMTVDDKLVEIQASMVELMNVTAVRDFGNCEAKASVIVDEVSVLIDVPATYLLWLDKRLEDMGTLVGNLPTRDPAEKWIAKDGGISRSDESQTLRMSKEPTVIPAAEATEHHPAQYELVNKDVPIGKWFSTKLSGAIEGERKRSIGRRIRQLHDAVKVALQEANSTKVEKQTVGSRISEFLFG